MGQTKYLQISNYLCNLLDVDNILGVIGVGVDNLCTSSNLPITPPEWGPPNIISSIAIFRYKEKEHCWIHVQLQILPVRNISELHKKKQRKRSTSLKPAMVVPPASSACLKQDPTDWELPTQCLIPWFLLRQSTQELQVREQDMIINLPSKSNCTQLLCAQSISHTKVSLTTKSAISATCVLQMHSYPKELPPCSKLENSSKHARFSC